MTKIILLVFATGSYVAPIQIDGFSSLQACQMEADRLIKLERHLSVMASYRCVEVK